MLRGPHRKLSVMRETGNRQPFILESLEKQHSDLVLLTVVSGPKALINARSGFERAVLAVRNCAMIHKMSSYVGEAGTLYQHYLLSTRPDGPLSEGIWSIQAGWN